MQTPMCIDFPPPSCVCDAEAAKTVQHKARISVPWPNVWQNFKWIRATSRHCNPAIKVDAMPSRRFVLGGTKTICAPGTGF